MMRDKRHLCNLSGDHPPTNLKEEGCSNLEVRLVNICHRDVLTEDRAGTTTADCPHLLTFLVVHSGTLTCGCTTRDKTNTLTRYTVLNLIEDWTGTDEPTFLTSSFS